MARRHIVHAFVTTVVAGIWCAVMLIPVDWPLSSYLPETAVFPLGPVSADVQPGQVFTAAEPFDTLAAPVRVGGPLDSAAELGTRLRLDGPRGSTVAASANTAVVSTHRRFEMALFLFPETQSADRTYFVEFDIPRGTRWPVFLAAVGGDTNPEGQLFMRGEPTHEGQDLVYQLLRRQSVSARLPAWWVDNPGAIAVGIGLLVFVHLTSFAALHALVPPARRRLQTIFVPGLVPPVLLVGAYFVLLFAVL